MSDPAPRPVVVQRWALAGLFLVVAVAALRLGSALFLPIVISGLFALMLAPPVRWLVKRRIPPSLAAAAVVLATVATCVTTVYWLASPAGEWVARAPRTLEQAEVKIRRLTRPLKTLQQTAEKVEQVTSPSSGTGPKPVQVAPAGAFSRLSGTTTGFIGGFFTVVFLTYFLLAQGERFRTKLDGILGPRYRARMRDGLRDMQAQMSTYLLVTTLINAAVGLVTWGALAAIGYPNPALWGVVAGVLNYIPYLGAVVTLAVLGLAGLVSFETTREPLLAMGAFFVVNMLEANVVTPHALGRRLPLNPVAIFVGLLFWGWVWGVTGAVLAVPLTVLIKVVADRVEGLKPLGEMLDN